MITILTKKDIRSPSLWDDDIDDIGKYHFDWDWIDRNRMHRSDAYIYVDGDKIRVIRSRYGGEGRIRNTIQLISWLKKIN